MIIFIKTLVYEIENNRKLRMLDKQYPLIRILLTVCSVK